MDIPITSRDGATSIRTDSHNTSEDHDTPKLQSLIQDVYQEGYAPRRPGYANFSHFPHPVIGKGQHD